MRFFATTSGSVFIDALLWMARSGARWRDLPERFGPFERAKKRYYRWIEMGVLARVFEAVAAEPDLEWVMLDATVIRAHAQAAGARRMANFIARRETSSTAS